MTKRTRSFPRTGRVSNRPHEARKEPDERPSPPLGDAARDAAIRAIARQTSRYPDLDLAALDQAIEHTRESLSGLDAAFAHALYDAVIRRWLTLEFLIQRYLSQPFAEIENRLRAVLLAGAAQMVFLERVPAHAAINHAVEWAKRTIRPGAGGLVNAVLRKIAGLVGAKSRRDRFTWSADELPLASGGALELGEAILPDDRVDRIAAATSHPRTLVERWLQTRAVDEVRALCLHNLCDAPVLLNLAHAVSPAAGSDTTPHATPGHAVYTGVPSDLGAFLRSRPDLWVQDAASSLAVDSIRALSQATILDLCAGQGTKTRQLAAIFPRARISATDIDQTRYDALRRTFAHSDRIRVLPFTEVFDLHRAQADLILLDVPCSNTGVLARRPEARYRVDSAHLESLTNLQRQILADSIPLLSSAGQSHILYSTCSLEPEENQNQARWAAHWHRFSISRERQTPPAGLPGDPPTQYTDGSYSVLLTRT